MGKAERPVIGSLDMIRRAPGGIRAAGWSIDQDTPASNEVHLYSGDGEVKPSSNPGRQLTANQFRQDIGNVYPQYGAHHGFDGIVAARNAGHQRVCAYGINAPRTPGSNRQLGCKDIHISPDPYGYVDSIRRVSGDIRVQGWTIDPDTASPITVHVYSGNGAPSTPSNAFTYGVANTSRPDVARHYPDYGDKHGFSLLLPTNSNPQTVCVYAINNGAGGHNPQLGCRRV